MPPLPKRKLSKARQGNKSSHGTLALPTVSLCPRCRSPRLAHRMCPNCGTYNGREVIAPKERAAGS